MKRHRLGVAAAVLVVVAFLVVPALPGLLPGGSLLDPPTVQALPAWEYLTIQRQTELSEIIVVGEVVRVDPAKWNTGSGKKPGTLSCASWTGDGGAGNPMVYATFYVQPTEVLKGAPRWGMPVAFRLTGVISESDTTDEFMGTLTTTEDDAGVATRIGVGDTVVVFGEVDPELYGGGVYEPADAYWLTMGHSSLWSTSEGDEETLRNHGLLRHEDEKALPLESLVAKIQGYLEGGNGGLPPATS